MCRVGVLLLVICAITPAVVVLQASAQETLAEEAVLTPLSDGFMLVHLQFTQTASCTRHCTTFPKAVGQLAAAIPFSSVELSLTQGRWHYHRWGAPLLQAKPAGAELRAHFSPTLSAGALPGLWGNLSHALGGLFCASLNFVARPEATAPLTIDMQPAQQQQQQQEQQQHQEEDREGVGWVPGASREHVLYASLPQEASCTENLTPWLKLLPCRDAAGLGQLLVQRGVVFGADYHSMQVNIDVQRDQQRRPTHTTLRQSFTMVLRPPSSSSSSSRSPPKPGTLSNISLAALLGSEAPTACPVTATSRLLLQLPQQVQSQQQMQALLQLPAYTAAAAAAAAAAGEEEHESELDQQQGQQDGSSSSGSSRADVWSGPGFTVKPAPDAAALLPPIGRGCANSLTAAAADHSRDDADGVLLYDSDSSSACRPILLYIWDLHGSIRPQSSAAAGASNSRAPFAIEWQLQQQPQKLSAAAAAGGGGAAATAAAIGPGSMPQFSVARYITGTGQLHGGMVLQLTAVHAGDLAQQGVAITTTTSSSSSMSVCIMQVVPWYIRLWLHTLRLTVDGQPTPLDEVLLPSYISPASDRKQPLVLDLCMSVPRSVRGITLTAQFTKAFLRMLEHPPDAHRGFDVPAAVVTVGDIPSASSMAVYNTTDSRRRRSTSSSGGSDSKGSSSSNGGSDSKGSSSERAWWVIVAPGAPAADELQQVTPLMVQLNLQRPPLVYSPGLVVPLAVPDFSMPYNVICLTSTVLAIFMGGVLNALLWRPGKDEREAADPKTAVVMKRKKIIRLFVLVVGFMVVAVYYDSDLQHELLKHARAFGLLEPVRDEL